MTNEEIIGEWVKSTEREPLTRTQYEFCLWLIENKDVILKLGDLDSCFAQLRYYLRHEFTGEIPKQDDKKICTGECNIPVLEHLRKTINEQDAYLEYGRNNIDRKHAWEIRDACMLVSSHIQSKLKLNHEY